MDENNPMADEIKAGDVVKLKSGGPAMTVAKVDEAGVAECFWFDELEGGAWEFGKGDFLVACLKRVADKTEPKPPAKGKGR